MHGILLTILFSLAHGEVIYGGSRVTVNNYAYSNTFNSSTTFNANSTWNSSSITLNGSSGYITSQSSINASAFFGNGSHLTGIVASNVPNTITSSFTIKSDELVTGSVTASAFFGDGSHLTGITSSGGNQNTFNSSVTVNSGGYFTFNSSSITLLGSSGYILSQSSITASGFFGDGSGLTGITATPSGSAGGDLTGTYPNPTIGAGKVTDSKVTLTTGAISSGQFSDNRVSVTTAAVISGLFGDLRVAITTGAVSGVFNDTKVNITTAGVISGKFGDLRVAITTGAVSGTFDDTKIQITTGAVISGKFGDLRVSVTTGAVSGTFDDTKVQMTTGAVISGKFGDNRVGISTAGVISGSFGDTQVSITTGSLSGTLPINKGGTNATTASAARTQLSAAQSGNNGDLTGFSNALTMLSSITVQGAMQTNSSANISGLFAQSANIGSNSLSTMTLNIDINGNVFTPLGSVIVIGSGTASGESGALVVFSTSNSSLDKAFVVRQKNSSGASGIIFEIDQNSRATFGNDGRKSTMTANNGMWSFWGGVTISSNSNSMSHYFKNTFTFDAASVGVGTVSYQTTAVTGAAIGDMCIVMPRLGATTPAFAVNFSSASTAQFTLAYINPSALSAVDPANLTYDYSCIRP